jgi:hypothetical protein
VASVGGCVVADDWDGAGISSCGLPDFDKLKADSSAKMRETTRRLALLVRNAALLAQDFAGASFARSCGKQDDIGKLSVSVPPPLSRNARRNGAPVACS